MSEQPKLDAARLHRMVEISRVLNSTTNLDDLLSRIISEAATLTNAEAASILLLDPKTRQLHFRASSNHIPPEMTNVPVAIDKSIAGQILVANQPMYIKDVTKHPRWNKDVDKAIQFQTRQILGVPMHNVNGEAVGVLESLNKNGGGDFSTSDLETITILADIAGVAVEKARLFEELEDANKELNELDEIKTNFIAVASHELRTPLGVILGYVSFLREEADPSIADQFDSVLNAAVHLRGLIQEMLNLRYVDAGDASLRREVVNFAELVKNMQLDQDETAVAKDQNITIQYPPTPIMVEVDADVMEVILGNLLNNAAKFTPPGGYINITLQTQGDEAWFRIKDNGIGIPADQMDRIFKRFYQVENPLRREHEGMGLGLSIAKELVELHNGRIWAESADQQGSEFVVALKLAAT